jgi:hypothetical protein
MAQIERSGKVTSSEAALNILEEGISAARAAGGHKAAEAWEHEYKNQVFKRVIWMMRHLGWICTMPEVEPHAKKSYGKYAIESCRRKRLCQKGDLKADVEMSGRSVSIKFFQSINTPDRADHEGRYQQDLEKHMTYMMRLEMERTRRRITKYLCNVFTDYQVGEEYRPKVGPRSITALEWKDMEARRSGHFVEALGHARIHCERSETGRDGGKIVHGATVWFKDWHTKRIFRGTAFYSLNDSWKIIFGKYAYTVCQIQDIYSAPPENLRQRLTADQREKRLNSEMNAAVKEMRFERAAQLRDILFPKAEPLFMLYHTGHNLYHRACFSGYSNNTHDAGKFTRAQLDDFMGKGVTEDHLSRVIPMGELA